MSLDNTGSITAATRCRWCDRKVERISGGTWADGKPMLRHVDTLQPRCDVNRDRVAEAYPVCPKCGDDDHLMANADGCSFTLRDGELTLVGMPLDVQIECAACSATAHGSIGEHETLTAVTWEDDDVE